METILLLFHVIACAGLILIVLLQAGKGLSLTGMFGGGGSDAIFGGGGGNVFLRKVTVVMAVVFVVTSISLTVIKARGPVRSVMFGQPAGPPAQP